MRTTLIALLLLLAVSAHASFDVEPPAPTDRSYVVVQVRDAWRDGCVPFDPQVTRTGNRIEVRWRLPQGGCPLLVVPWRADVPIGVLPAGSYELVLNVDDRSGLRTVAAHTVVVSEAMPAFTVQPNVISATAPAEVTIRTQACFGAGSVVTMNGAAVPSRVSECALVATLPPHAAGAVNLRVQSGSFDRTVVAAVRYVDPAAAPDPLLYERVLVPVLYQGPGAYGSLWASQVEIVNASPFPATFVPDVAKPLTSIAPRASAPLDVFGNRPSGLLLFVQRGLDLRFGSLIRDLSRESAQWGTEQPVVRERDTTRGSITLPNVPFDPRYRLQLRIYGIDGEWLPVVVRASRGGESLEQFYDVTGPCGEHPQTPCNSNQPSYLSLDLTSEFPALAGKGAYRIEIEPAADEESHRMWAFVSVTNNDTQHVTLITPLQ